ncbi:MAG: N-acetylmuramoyl-L-alanine amidase [Nitrospina sp.]|nr:N-acetylmuramoyl-L-alanine amidase [Nitrospina sp.]
MIPKRETTERVVVHFTGNGEEDMDSIRAEHEARGLPEVGFHFFIDAEGKLFMGRHQSRVGAHHPEFDAISIGVCVIGDRFFLNEEQELAMILLMDKLRADYPQAEKVNYVYRQPTG